MISHLRENTFDKFVAREARNSYRNLLLCEDSVVFDIGANIGGFASYALGHPIKRIICFEPDRDNFLLLEKNVNNERAILHECALTLNLHGLVALYTNQGKNKGAHSLERLNGCIPTKVLGIPFFEMLEKYKPDTLKIDIEGSEYSILAKPLPEYVRRMAVEFHLQKKSWRKIGIRWLLRFIKEQGFRTVKPPVFCDYQNITTGVFER